MHKDFGALDIPVDGRPTTLDEAKKLAEMDTDKFEQWAVSLLPRAKPTGGKPIDGVISFVDDTKMHQKKCVVEVTSGHPNKKHFDAFLKHAGKAEMGVYVTLHQPSPGMIADAKEMGVYHSPEWNINFPKLQIALVKDLLEGRLPQLPPAYKKHGKGAKLIS